VLDATSDSAMKPRAVRIYYRHEIPASDTWDLGLLFSTEDEYRAALEQVHARYKRYREFEGRITESAQSLVDYLKLDKSIDLALEKLTHYASLKKAEANADPANTGRWSALQNLGTKIAEARAFAVPEIQRLTDARFNDLIRSPVVAPWKIYLDRIRRYRTHTLRAGEERLLALAGASLSGYKQIFSQLMNVDMKFGTLTTNHGEKITLTLGLADSLQANPDRGTRRRAFRKLYRQVQNHQSTLAATLAASVRADVLYARSRRFGSALEAALFSDDVPVAVYDNLITNVRSILPVVHRYYALRRQAFGELYYYDTFIPIAPQICVHTQFNEAIELVCSALAPLGNEYVETLRRGFTARWVDRYETPGKRPGSFSSGSYRNPPFMLMNYRTDSISSVFSVAHEAGHSMHTWFSQNAQPFRYYKPPILLTEVAAMVNEELLTDYWLAKTAEPKIRAFLIDQSLERMRSVLVRQTMFAEFEKIIHAAEESGGGLTLEFFRETYARLLRDYLGPDITIDPELELECLRIPHFYSAFYVYRYAIGLTAAITLARKIQTGGSKSQRQYQELLRAGRTRFSVDALVEVGVDLCSSKPIEYTMDIFAQRLEQLEALMRQLAPDVSGRAVNRGPFRNTLAGRRRRPF
jgi:oligoendopeptidase F